MTDSTERIPSEHDRASSLERRALEQMRASAAAGYDPYYHMQYRYVRPSPGRYGWQWFWDSCFHVIVNARLDPELARDELRSLVATQDPDGFIGHVIYWGRRGSWFAAVYLQSRLFQWRRRHSDYIQPPLLAQAVEAVWDATGDGSFLGEMLPKLTRYYDWLRQNRDPDGTGLIAIISPFESGLDNSPAYDEVLGLRDPGRAAWLFANRKLDLLNIFCSGNIDLPTVFRRDRFVVYDALVNAVNADGLRTLARLYDASGDDQSAAREGQNADRAGAAINELCWDEAKGAFLSLAGHARQRLQVVTIASLLPLIVDSTPPERRAAVVERYLTNRDEFWTDFPVPTVARSEPSFDPSGEKMIWRGPMGMGTNWLLERGLRRHGFTAEAARIAERSLQAAETHGFREFYNPLTGQGMRGERFGWGTLAIAMGRAGR